MPMIYRSPVQPKSALLARSSVRLPNGLPVRSFQRSLHQPWSSGDHELPTTASSGPVKTNKTAPATSIPDSVRKCFVLDTNVLLHNPNAIYMFKEHEVVIPLVVI